MRISRVSVNLLVLLCCDIVHVEPFQKDANGDNNILDDNSSIGRHKRTVSYGPPAEGQSSLVFIFDDTGSMHDDLVQLRGGAKKIAREFANSDNNPFHDYVLVRFNDPVVRPASRSNKVNDLLHALDQIDVDGGGDCPEMAFQGIISGMNAALASSQVFVFTDASAKDNHLLDKTIQIAQSKQMMVSFLITGNGCVRDRDFDAFHKLAKASNGQVYNLEKTSVEQVISTIGELLDTGLIRFEAIYSETAGSHVFSVDVDKSMKEISVSVAGRNPKIDMHGPVEDRDIHPKTLLDMDAIKIVKVDDPAAGKWSVNTSSSSPHSIKISGTSDILYRYGFSFILPEVLSETAPNPIKDVSNYLSLFVWKNKAHHTFTAAELVIVTPRGEKSHANRTLKILDPSKCDEFLCIHATEAFIPPLDTFRIYIRGHDADGNDFRYLVSTNIEAVDGESLKPKVEIVTKIVKVKEGEKAQFVCKVNSKKRAVITWTFEDKAVEDNSGRRVNFVQNDTVHLDFFRTSLDDEGSYFCYAKNPYGQHHEKASLIIEAIPWNISMPETALQVIESKENYEIKCDISPSTVQPSIKWQFNGKLMAESSDIQTSSKNTLNFKKIHRHHKGNYTCIGAKDGIIKNATVSLNVLYPAEISGPLHEKRTVRFGDRIILNCSASGNPDPNIAWLREDETPSSNVIEEFSAEHYGTHVCKAWNKVGKPARKFIVLETEYGLKPKVFVERKLISANEGDSMTFRCEIISPKPMTSVWLFNDLDITATNITWDITSLTNGSVIKISSIKLEHAGDYTCVGRNIYGEDKDSIKVEVIKLPLAIEMKPLSMNATENDRDFTIECTVLPNNRKLNLKWMFEDRVLHDSSEFQISGHKLVIPLVNRNHTGNYTCIGDFLGETKTSTGSVIVFYPPEIQGPTEERHQVQFEDTISLNCSAIGNPTPTITWLREDESLSESEIKRFEPHHYGYHICEASNGIGVPALKKIFLDSKANGPPELIHSDYYEEIRSGQNYTLKCGCEKCGPIIYYYWSRLYTDKSTIIPDVKGILDESSKNFQVDYVITNAQASDSGIYECGIYNQFNGQIETMRINVLDGPVITDIIHNGAEIVKEGLIKVKQGNELILTCVVTGSPEPLVRWYKNGDPLPPSRNFAENTIKIESLDENHIGKYTCKVLNKLGSDAKDIHVHVEQNYVPISTILQANEGQTVSLPCESHTWLYNDEPLVLNESRHSYIENVLIFEATYADSGVYTCISNNGSETVKLETVLLVRNAPSIIPEEDNDVYVHEGQDQLLVCRAVGNPRPKITWWMNDRKLSNSGQYKLLGRGDLLIKNVQKRNRGTYTCRATNKVSQTQRGTNLFVIVPPKISSDVPSSLKVNPGDPTSRLNCAATGIPKPNVSWLKDGQTYVSEKTNANPLYISPTMPAGNYSCVATNSGGQTSKSTQIETPGPPKLITNLLQTKHHLHEGADLLLPCPFEEATQIDWLWNGIKFTGDRIGDSDIFILPSVRPDQSGIYTCVAKNHFGEVNFTHFVEVFESSDPYAYDDVYEVVMELVGQSLMLDCNDGFSETNWVRNGRVISLTSELVLENLKRNDTGKYVCKNFDGRGSVDKAYYVKVLGPPETDLPNESWFVINTGDNLELECILTGFPVPDIIWTKDSTTLNATKTLFFIRSATLASAGTYKCSGRNKYGVVDVSYHVEVLQAPEIKKLSNAIVLRPTDSLTLRCEATGYPLPTLVWTLNGSRIFGTEMVKPSNSSRSSSIYLDGRGNIVPRIVRVDEIYGLAVLNKTNIRLLVTIPSTRKRPGAYTCQAINVVDVKEVEVNVEIIEPPDMSVRDSFSKTNIIAGLPLYLTCPWASNSATKLYWQKNGYMFNKGVTTDQNVLSLPATKAEDSGIFECVAKNIAGELRKTFDVSVRGLPYYDIDSASDDVILKCPIPNASEERIVWEEFSLGEENITNYLPEDSNNLIINHDRPSSIYFCYHENLRSRRRTKQLGIQVIKTSPLKYHETTQTVSLNSAASLHCSLVLRYPKSPIVWYKDERRLLSAPNWSFSKNGANLNFRQVRNEDEGIYKCRTAAGSDERGIVLKTKRSTPKWSEWQPWTSCSKSCNGGFRTRRRYCISLDDTAKDICGGADIETQACNNFSCPKNGQWSEWSSWSTCPSKCWNTLTETKPLKHRSRECNSAPSSMGGKLCEGPSIETEECENDPCPIHGGWSSWSNWGACSVTCGIGERIRFRECNNPEPKYGGRDCTGPTRVRQRCSLPRC